MTYYYTSPAVLVGKHEWRFATFDSQWRPGQRCAAPEWRRAGADHWHDMRDWPSYDSHDGCFAGLPRSLPRVLAPYIDAGRAAMTDAPPAPSPQMALPL